MRRNAHRRTEPAPQATPEPSTATEAPKPPSAGPVEPVNETVDVQTGEEIPAPKGPLSELQDKVRALLDYDQIAEIRLALSARSADLEKHVKKAGELGVREEDARRRIRLIEGSDTRFGLLRIFAPESATYDVETRDLFFDQERPDGRPEGEDEADAAALAAETGTATDSEWDQGAPGVTPDGAERVASAAGV